MMGFEMFVPTKTLFGQGKLNDLHTQHMPGKKAMIVISNGKSTIVNGYLDRTQEQLRMAGISFEVFHEVEPNPLKSTVMRGGAFARSHNCDFIVALGGGSVMDASKAIAIVATNSGDLWDYVVSGTGKGQTMKANPLPIIAITTTAGTGSETDCGGVITNEDTKEKIGIVFPSLFPVLAIVDPELMTTVPPKFTAFQGFDALFHSVEGYISNKANLMSDMIALTAIEQVTHNLAKTIKDGNNIEAREKVAFGNYLSGIEMCVGSVSSQHSLEHAMSAYHQDLPHGAGLIMLSKSYFTFFIEKHVCDERFMRMAKVMGIQNPTNPMDFITALLKLQEDCGVADLKMSDYGIMPKEFEIMAKNAKSSMTFLFTCDRYSLTEQDCVTIYKNAYC